MRTLAVIVLLLLNATEAWAQRQSIQQFNGLSSKWSSLVGTDWQLEGRYGLVADRTMTFRNCDLRFVLDEGVLTPRSGTNVVEVSGKLERGSDGKVQFRVSQLRSLPTDLETLSQKRGGLNTRKPEEWYELAAWATNRGNFYDDQKLLAEVQDLNLNGLKTELRNVSPDDVTAQLKLRDKATMLQLPERFVQALSHSIYRTMFSQILTKQRGPGDYATLRTSIARDLKDAASRLSEYPEALAKTYHTAPLPTYESVTNEQRLLIHRIFYLDVMVTSIEADAAEDGSNGFEIARRLAANAPERSDLVSHYREQELKYRISRVDVMARQEMLDLAQLLTEEKDPERATRVKREWLRARESFLVKEGARGYVDLAQEWLTLMEDRETAIKYYLAAWDADPKYEPALNWLTENGYLLVNGRWYPEDEAPQTQNVMIQRAVRDGRVMKGMTAAQARAAMGAKPDRILRFAANSEITELWVYESSRTLVRLVRSNRRGETHVTSIDKMVSQ